MRAKKKTKRFYTNFFFAAIIILLLMVTACASGVQPRYSERLLQDFEHIRNTLDQVWVEADSEAELGSLAFSLSSYVRYFGFSEDQFFARYIHSPQGNVFTSWLPALTEADKGTMLLIHGYRGHGAHFAQLTRRLTIDGWNIFIIDLPGHGLSEGSPYYIQSFSDYGRMLMSVSEELFTDLEKDHRLIYLGWSTGCSSIAEALRLAQIDDAIHFDETVPWFPDAIVFGAPLIALPQQDLRFGLNAIAPDMIIPIPDFAMSPAFYDDGYACNPEFKEFVLFHDPFHYPVYDPRWLTAFENWYKVVAEWETPVYEKPLLLLQGANDSVVNWSLGEKVFHQLFHNTQVVLFEDYSHGIFNLAPERMDAMYAILSEFLDTSF